MNFFGMLLSLALFNSLHPSVLLIDTNLKKPASQTDDFGLDDYTRKKFPIYSTDIEAVVAASEKVVKMIEHQTDFTFDTVLANRTAFILNTEIENYDKVTTVRLVTVIEKDMSFSFELVKRESNTRKMQRKLLQLGDYLLK